MSTPTDQGTLDAAKPQQPSIDQLSLPHHGR
jgi:hypothetical protein